MKIPVYLDYSSTTPVDPRVAEKMMKYLTLDGTFGNPSSRSHLYGWKAEEAIDISRNQISSLIKSQPKEIIFTSGATESNNLALKGVAYSTHHKKHIITSVTEHKSIINSCKYLEKRGFSVTWLIPKKNGIITPKQLSNALRKDTILVSLMHVNNETGIIQDIAKFSEICHANEILLHVDSTQSIGKLPIDVSLLPIDLMSFSSHKIYGPKGIGVLFIRNNLRIKIQPQIHGGGQEQGIRSGTLPVHQIVGMGEACQIASQTMSYDMSRIKLLRDRLWNGLQSIKDLSINSDLKKGIVTILNISFLDIDQESLVLELKNLAISTGSACNSDNYESYSYVLKSMGLNKNVIRNSIRISFGRFTTQEEIDYAIVQIRMAALRLRKHKLY